MTLTDQLAELEAAGVEVPEVEEWERLSRARVMTRNRMLRVPRVGDAALSALIALVLKYKWQRDYVVDIAEEYGG
jgi:hypothetical protein